MFRRISSLTIRNKFFECMGGSLQTEHKELIFITVYRFHGNESEFIEHFTKVIFPYKDKPLLILGDLNLNLFEYDNNKHIDDFVNSMMSNSLFPLVNKATNFFRGSSTLIDHAWTNILNNSTKCDVADILTSSHKPLLSFLPTKLKHFIDESGSNNTNVKLHNINSDSLNNFSNELDSFLSNRSYKYSEPIKNSTMVKSTFSDFYSTVTHLYNKHIVVDKVFKSNRNKYDKPWITTGLAKACKVKSKLHNIWIKSRGTMKENAAKTNYKSCRSKLKKFIQQAELNYFENKFSNASGNIRKAWSVINSIRCKSKNNKLPNFIDTNGVIVTNRREICTKFNEYFVNVARKLNIDKYNNVDAPDFKQYLRNSVNNSLFLSPITDNETHDIINSLDSNKSNDISPKLLKALCNTFCPILTYLFNLCMLTSSRKPTSMWFSVDGMSVYEGKNYAPNDLKTYPSLLKLLGLVNEHPLVKAQLDCLHILCYSDNKHTLRLHADNEPYIDGSCPIATVSIGASRKIEFVPFGNKYNNMVKSVTAVNNSMYVMNPGCQTLLQHRVTPGNSNECTENVRYSLSFRKFKSSTSP